VGIAGVQLGQEQKPFLISDEQWQKLQALFPLGPLQAYGNANGLVFERIAASDVAGHHDSVLLIEQAYAGTEWLTLSSGTRSYLMLLRVPWMARSCSSSSTECSCLPKRLSPASSWCDSISRWNCRLLNWPRALRSKVRPVCLGATISSCSAHFALCDHEPELADWLSPQWQSCLLSGTVPVHTAATSLPEWFSVIAM
jgi:hypothetical protein